MTMFTVSLGGFNFQDEEVPSCIIFGVEQKHVKQIMIGGQVQVDALGWVDSDIGWTGRFHGANAQDRALELQSIAQQGSSVPLIWAGMYYSVLIVGFHANFEKPFEIPYEVHMVVTDSGNGGGGFSVSASLDARVGVDVTAAIGALS